MVTDLDALATELYVTADDLFLEHPGRVPARPKGGFEPKCTDAEMVTLAVIQALLGFSNERKWIRYADHNLRGMFPDLPKQATYNKRIRALGQTMRWLITELTAQTTVSTDDVWVADSTPVECGRSRETALRSDLAGIAEYGYCASHTRYFWGLRLHLVCTVHGAVIAWGLTGAKANERDVLSDLAATAPLMNQDRDRPQLLIADKGYNGQTLEAELNTADIGLLRPTRKGEPQRPGESLFKPVRQVIESINETLKGQLNLERDVGRTWGGVCARVAQRLLAMTTAIWFNDKTGAKVLRSLTAYDH